MTIEEQKSGNKLIAEHMGWVHSVVDHHGINLFHLPDGDKIPLYCKQQSLEGFQYHSSWDALMPVVKKIMDFEGNDIGRCKESKGWCAYYAIPSFLEMVDMEKVRRYCIEFIEWYNETFKGDKEV